MKIFLIIIFILIVTVILIYNKLVKMDIRCKNAWSQIDNQLKRRADLIPNLVDVTKGYAKHESETLQKIAQLRSGSSVSEMASNSEKVSKNLKDLLAVAEGYPDLKANQVFLNLQIELTGTEDKIAFARQFYNDSVQIYNTAIQVFPNNIFANIFHYKEREYFNVSESDKKNVEVKLKWYLKM